jgi:hypothetical protein
MGLNLWIPINLKRDHFNCCSKEHFLFLNPFFWYILFFLPWHIVHHIRGIERKVKVEYHSCVQTQPRAALFLNGLRGKCRGWVHLGFSIFGVQSHSGFSPIRGWFHSRFSPIRGSVPFGVQSIWGWVHLWFSPFEVQSIPGWVFLGWVFLGLVVLGSVSESM